MIQRYISLMDKIIDQHPEHKYDLHTIKCALEKLNSAEEQLKSLIGHSLSDMYHLLGRNSAGNEIDNPLPEKMPDIFLPINHDIIHAISILRAERTAGHLSQLHVKELLLASGAFYEKFKSKKKNEAKMFGAEGGEQQKNIVQPLVDEIRRLFIGAIKNKPKMPHKKDYANMIHDDVVKFIALEPGRYTHVGPKDKTTAYAYQDYIISQVRDIKLKKQSIELDPPPSLDL